MEAGFGPLLFCPAKSQICLSKYHKSVCQNIINLFELLTTEKLTRTSLMNPHRANKKVIRIAVE